MEASTARPMLFLVVDSIPLDLAREVHAAGGMPGFDQPRPVVSVFPSLTHVAVPALVRGVFHHQPPGYEARYYHPPSQTVRGGFGTDAEAAMEPFQTRPKGNLGHLAVYLLTDALAYGQVRWITWKFTQHHGPWLGYLSATDGVAHFEGRQALGETLRDIFEQVAEVRERFRREEGVLPEAVIASDHGFCFSYLQTTEVQDLVSLFEVEGLELGGRGPDGVMMAPLGEVGAGAAWCAPARAGKVAQVLAEAPGVELAFAREGDGCLVFGVRHALESARIEWQDGATRYTPLDGDPLDLGDLAGRWIADAALLAVTWDRRFPFAPARVRDGLTTLVQWPAPVLFSMADGRAFGPTITHAAAQLRGGQVGTHGALTRVQSLGFATCSEGWRGRGPLRPEDVFAPWADKVRAGAVTGD